MILSVLEGMVLFAILAVLIWMVVDAVNASFRKPVMKYIWLFLLTVLPVIGMGLYFFVGRKMKL